jgi:signal transduction histidine kinase/CheY-like chemotaxis protein
MTKASEKEELIQRIAELEMEISGYRRAGKKGKATDEGVIQDMTEDKIHEEALRRQKEYLEALHETSLGLISRLDLDELLEAIIVRAGELVNAKNGFIYQYDADSGDLIVLAGMGIYAPKRGYRLKADEGLAGQVWQTGKKQVIDDYRNWSGRVKDPLFDEIRGAIGIPLKSGSKITGVMGLNRIGSEEKFNQDEGDILDRFAALSSIALENAHLHAKVTRELAERKRAEKERKLLEEQFLQAQKMEAIGTLAGGIAHDFNNILMAMQGNVSLILLKTDPDNPHYRKLKNFEKYIHSGSDLTRQLLGLAKGGKCEVKPSDLNKLAQKTAKLFGRTKKEINLHTHWQEDIWLVDVDRSQIEQVLLNLYVNSWQAMPDGGDMYVRTENYFADESFVKPYHIPPGRYVKISVTDNGVGMSKEVRQRIFDPFFTTKELSRGTGLGLASTYGIIKNHKGIINVYSEEAKGSTFNIYLPASEARKPLRDEAMEAVLSGSERILFIDDEEMIIDVGREILEELGYQVTLAKCGKEAVEVYKEKKDDIDIVILDMIMPDLSGKEVFHHLIKIDPKVKILLSSGYALDGRASELIDLGCNGFIQKPFNLTELSQKIRQILD